MSLSIISQVLLWLLVIGLSVVVFALARQIGVLHERIAPLGALALAGGPAVGDPAPKVVGRRLGGERFDVAEGLVAGRARLLLFVAADCPLCKKVIPLAKSVANTEDLELVFIGDGPPDVQRALVARFKIDRYPFVNGPEFGIAFGIGKLPYGVLVTDAGLIAAKGLVNSREHLESLVVAAATGFGSVQQYLANRRPSKEAV